MHFDFVIVGGGAHGCALAYELAKSNRTVALVEARSLAAEASGGFGKRGVRGNFRDIRELPLMVEGYEQWPRLADELEGDTGYARTGGLFLIEKETVGTTGGVVASQSRAEIQTRLGVASEIWDRARVLEALPQASESIRCGIYVAQDGVAAQEATTLSYAQAAQRHGAVIIDGAQVTGILCSDGGRATGVEIDSSRAIHARQNVIITANVETAGLIKRSYDTFLPVWPIYPQAILLKAQNTPQIPLLTGHDSRTLSVKIIDDELIMLSGGWRGRFDPQTGRGTTIEENLHNNIAELKTVFPGLGEVAMVSAEASRSESSSIDQIPIIDVVPGSSNVVVATGWAGHGWALVPSVAKNLSRWLLTGDKPAALNPFALSRFSQEPRSC